MAASQDLRGSRYRSNGSAAYDIRTYGNAVPKPRGPGLPEERPRPVRRQRVKAKTAVSPFAALGLVAAALMLVMVIFSYVQLYEATSEVGRLQEELAALQEERQALTSQYEGQIDLAAIETRARELGMVQPTSIETVYLKPDQRRPGRGAGRAVAGLPGLRFPSPAERRGEPGVIPVLTAHI